MLESVFRLPGFDRGEKKAGHTHLQKATQVASAARLDMRAPRLACAPLAYAALLVALTSARRDEDQSTHLQPALDTRPRRPAHAPERRFSVAELEEGQRSAGATIQYVGDVPSRSTATPKLRYSDESSVIGHSLSEPTMKRVRANVQRCGFTWDDAAAKCGRPCPYGLASECNEKAAPLPPNSSWINSTYSCYVSGHHSNMHTHVHMHTHTCTRIPLKCHVSNRAIRLQISRPADPAFASCAVSPTCLHATR